jgi:hypothetical protein
MHRKLKPLASSLALEHYKYQYQRRFQALQKFFQYGCKIFTAKLSDINKIDDIKKTSRNILIAKIICRRILQHIH